MDSKQISVLITWDVDPDRWATVEQRENAISMALDLCEELGIRSTFFITANHAHEYPTLIDRMHLLNQEIGCHGLTHTDEEDYDSMLAGVQEKYIKEATQKLETVIGKHINSFRSPRVKTSHHTLKLLSENGYQTDSSVCSQRMDLVSSNLINPGWLFAPRRPYHPHQENAFKSGDLPLWEVPISAAIVAFISSSLKVFGLRFMKAFFRFLNKESRFTGKPIVYLAHPAEFISLHSQRPKLTLADFSPKRVKTHGFLVRNFLFRLAGNSLFDATRELFAYISTFPNVTFVTCNEYTEGLIRQSSQENIKISQK